MKKARSATNTPIFTKNTTITTKKNAIINSGTPKPKPLSVPVETSIAWFIVFIDKPLVSSKIYLIRGTVIAVTKKP